MSVGLRNVQAGSRANVANQRLANRTFGLGYWAAMDFKENQHRPLIAVKKDMSKKLKKRIAHWEATNKKMAHFGKCPGSNK